MDNLTVLLNKDKRLLRFIQLAPFAVIALVSLSLIVYIYQIERNKFNANVEALRSSFIDVEESMVEQKINYIQKQIEYNHNNVSTELRDAVKARVEDAYQIASQIYKAHTDEPEDVLKQHIIDILRPFRFFDNRGYYFIFTMDGTSVMHPLVPNIEGTNQIGAIDLKGTPILKEHIALVKEHGASFYHWWYPMPGKPLNVQFEKIGYAKEFKPFNWMIGTGEYVKNYEQIMKTSTIKWFSQFVHNVNSVKSNPTYLLMDNSGQVIAATDVNFLSKELFNIELPHQSLNWSNFKHQTSSTVKLEGLLSFEGGKTLTIGQSHIIYRPLPYWGWSIITTIPNAYFENLLKNRFEQLKSQQSDDLLNLVYFSVLFSIIVLSVSLYIGRLVQKRIIRLQANIHAHINELEEAKNQMQYMAMRDELTTLPNRATLVKRVDSEIAQAKKTGDMVVIVFVDLDDFKKINDKYGHSIGDQLLVKVAAEFEQRIEPTDLVARFGGDEFVFCLSNLHSFEEARARIHNIKGVFEQHYQLESLRVKTGFSLGACAFPNDGLDAESLIKNADIALYRAKNHNRGDVVFYDENINNEIQYLISVEEHIHTAIVNEELSVVYQPQVELESLNVVGVEALVRWKNSHLGFVPPDVFISVAEDAGIIDNIGMFVFRRACKEIVSISPNGNDAVQLSVNISPKQILADRFVESLLSIMDEVGIDYHRVQLEITEGVLIKDFESVSDILNDLRNKQIGISLDDFGKGYSSLSYLNQLPINEIKIDKSFVHQMMDNATSRTLINSIFAMAKVSDLIVVAEGVETYEQMYELKQYQNCVAQGYYFDKPLTIDQLMVRLGQRYTLRQQSDYSI
ncbi:EAL domain-containing protein [Vibrio sp.]|nr:EAL domain-containing protein [Vibrio sp.]